MCVFAYKQIYRNFLLIPNTSAIFPKNEDILRITIIPFACKKISINTESFPFVSKISFIAMFFIQNLTKFLAWYFVMLLQSVLI